MRARERYELLVRRGGHGPAWLAAADRTDHVEVVGVDEGEVVYAWDLPPKEAGRLVRALREDLHNLEPEEFVVAWAQAGG